MIFKPIEALSIASLFLGSPLLGGLFDWLNTPPDWLFPPEQSSDRQTLKFRDIYANPTYLTKAQIEQLRTGQIRFWSDLGYPYGRVDRPDSVSEFYYFPTLRSEVGVIVESDAQAVLLSWDFWIQEIAIAPEYVPPPAPEAIYTAEPPAPEQYAAATEQQPDCIPYP